MRIAMKILTYLGLALVSIVGLVFAFVELRSLFAGDFSLFNNPATAFVKYFFRGLYYLSLAGVSIVTIIYLIKRKETNVYLATFSAAILISSGFTVMFYVYYIAIAIVVMALILFGINYLYLPKKETNDTQLEQ